MQEFMFHVLRNCYIVVMTARDESSSFRIFSTLNGRGVDLSAVDKLKADLLQVRLLTHDTEHSCLQVIGTEWYADAMQHSHHFLYSLQGAVSLGCL